MRKLASIQLVESVRKHSNADTLDLITINGWQCVAKIDEFREGDKVVYFEADSFLPMKPEYEFLRGNCFRSTTHLGDGFRLRTIKLRGELSQGLVMPLDVVGILDPSIPVDTDLTEVLGVQKWEPPTPTSLGGHPKGSFPHFIPKTDQPRIQNVYKDMAALERLYGPIEWVMEEKMDGSSCTIYYNDGEVGVCSHNWELKLDDVANDENAFIVAARRDGYLTALANMQLNIAVQAELCGPGIQGNKYKLKKPTLFVFDVWIIDEHRYASFYERARYINQLCNAGVGLDIHTVPWLGETNIIDYLKTIIFADGMSQVNPDSMREGIVYKSSQPVNGRIASFKAVSNQYLLKDKS
jgi:RNA ligase (TIGR02306 family)